MQPLEKRAEREREEFRAGSRKVETRCTHSIQLFGFLIRFLPEEIC